MFVPNTSETTRHLMTALNRGRAELYTRQDMLNLRHVEEAVVVGVGGTGTWVALLLAMSGTKKLHLMDGDQVEESNLNRLPFPQRAVNKLKTEVVKLLIRYIRSGASVYCYGRADARELEFVEGEILFDCTDNHRTQAMLKDWATQHRFEYIRVGYDGLHMTVTDKVSRWGMSDRTGYETTPSWVVPAIIAAAFGVAKAMLDNGIDISASVQELGRREQHDDHTSQRESQEMLEDQPQTS
jgi:hypothetical protein